jgi:O-acetyl-ADP-ribose deacetylase (regulator of RNase III)
MSNRRIVSGGDLFASGCSTFVNAVNCRGVMGAGIAAEFKRRYPAMFADYCCRCERGEVRLGRPYLWQAPEGALPSVLNFPTKDDWREGSRLTSIADGLVHLRRHYREWGVVSLAVPALGCGRGGLGWDDVRLLLVEYLSTFDIPVLVYAPSSRARSAVSR